MSSELEANQSKNRNFICSCQKAYLSYAALFTHIKQKHGGKAPGQIVRPRSLNKRGRPRKNDKPSSQKITRGESYNGFSNNNNLKNSNLVNESNINQNLSAFKTVFGKGFTSYKNDNSQAQPTNFFKNPEKPQNQLANYQSSTKEIMKQLQEEDSEFGNGNSQISSNTLTLASIIVGLQQFFKEPNYVQLVSNERLEAFRAYFELKRYHSLKLAPNNQLTHQQDAFILGDIICAFLNFCHQTFNGNACYQQLVLLMVCFLEHIREQKSGNILIQCRKEVIHESLPSFFQQYLGRVIIKSRLNFWIFKQNNPFRVLIWFLNWLSTIEAKYLQNHLINNPIQQLVKEEDQPLGGEEIYAKEEVYAKEEEDYVQGKENNDEEEPPFQEDQQYDENGVEFEHPTFLKQVIMQERLKVEDKTRVPNEKKKITNGAKHKDQSDFSQSVKSSEEQEKVEIDQNSQRLHNNDSQANSQQDQSQQSRIIGLQRLSSEVR